MAENAGPPPHPSADAGSESVSGQTSPLPPDAEALDSFSFLRCAGCRHAKEVDSSAGTLLCDKHNMRINAELDEIPDDCPEHEGKG